MTGIAGRCCTLASATGDARYGDAAHQAMDYERSVFSPVRPTGPICVTATLPESDAPRCMAAWCHGAVGIGLNGLTPGGFLSTLHGYMPATATSLTSAPSTKRFKPRWMPRCGTAWRDHSALSRRLAGLDLCCSRPNCCGMGPDAARRPRRLRATAALPAAGPGGRLALRQRKVTMPSLMLGLAGIGYQLLRLADPDQVPSLLLMAPPHAT
ncbi:MAG: hypothetical protein R2851_07615 [Caldilineaceae bacterium]